MCLGDGRRGALEPGEVALALPFRGAAPVHAPVEESSDGDDGAEDCEQEAVDGLRQHPERERDDDGRECCDERE
jgi:hypothetical protein